MAIEPEAVLAPNPPVPAEPLQMAHQVRIGKAPISHKDDLTAPRQPQPRPVQEVLVGLRVPLRAAVVEHTPHQRHSAAAIEHRNPDQAAGIPHHRGAQSQIEPVLPSVGQCVLHQRTIQRANGDLIVVAPPAKPSHRALRLLGATHQVRRPGAQADLIGRYEAHHHPREGLEVAQLHPMCLVAEHLNQRIIQRRRVLHGYPP